MVYRENVLPSTMYQSINSLSSSLSIPIFQQPVFNVRCGINYVCTNGRLSLVVFVVYRHWNENWGIPPPSKSQSSTFPCYTFSISPSTRYEQLEGTMVRLYIDWLICNVRRSRRRSLQGPLRLAAKKHLNYCRLYSARLVFHPDGYVDWGYDENGFDEFGFNEYDFDIMGYN